MIFHEIWMHFCSKMCRSKSFYAIRFSLLHCYFLHSSFCMLPFFLQAACRIQSAIFQIYRKSQEHAEKFRNLQMASVSKNADIERRLTIYYLQNAVICTKAPSNKRGAGGARAARRIRIRRPPSRGAEGVSNPTAYSVRLQKPLTDPALPADPPMMYPFCRPLRLKRRFFVDFLPFENSSKI